MVVVVLCVCVVVVVLCVCVVIAFVVDWAQSTN